MFLSIYLTVAWAGPEGAEVVNGQVSFEQSGYNTVITASDKAIINYSSFDILQPEIVEFIQPGSSASVLNRILSANPTNINGTLLANGRVFFVNPAGVYIGAGARINVNQLVASGLDISNSDFINGRYNFAGGDGSVINSGDILAQEVYLIGKQVANSGSISCPDGYVVMAAGDRIFLGEPGSDIVLEVDAVSLLEELNPAELDAAILNEGTVEAAGGTIVLAAAGDIYSQAISNVGSLSVSIETDEAGQITLIAPDGQITNAGTIEASGDAGGSITIDGADVVLTADSVIQADATGTGDGGLVSIYADDLELDGVITAGSVEGLPGTVLLDPLEFIIDASEALTIVSTLNTTNVIIEAENNIDVNAEINSSGQTSATTLSLNDENSDDDLTINLSKSIILGDNQTLTGEGTTVNVLSEEASIQNGIDVSAEGATITVSDGTYTEDLTVDKADLTLSSVNGRDYTTIELVDGVGIDIGSGGDGFTLGGGDSDGFEIVSGTATTFDIQFTNAPSDVEISWNTIDTTGNASMGISVGAAGATGLDINNNIFTAGDLGDGSIWGPDMVDVSVIENIFTGPAVHASSGYAVQFAGVTGTSAIEDNIISNYGMGIVIHNGTGTSGLSISGNDISDSSNGIRFYQYSPSGVHGDMTAVTVANNRLTDNMIGLRIGDGANVLASSFIIQNNSFSGNTTALANEHTSEDITATQNYWGDVDGPAGIGPGSGDPITAPGGRDVDYSPWWGGDYIGDAHTTAWTWGTNDSIQDAIDLASATVSDRIFVTSGIYSEMLDINKQLEGIYFRGDGSFASEIDGTVTLNADLDIYTQNDGDLTLNTVSDAGSHSLLVDTGSGTLNLDEDITANSGISLDGGIINVGNDTGDKITSDGVVSIAGTDAVTVNAAIDPTTVTITSEGDASVNINNAITADTQITITADDDVIFTADGDLSVDSGSIIVTADADSDADGSGGAVTMADGTEIDAGNGTISLAADEDITIGRLVIANDTAAAISITTTSGAVTDAGDIGGADIETSVSDAGVIISAAAGIGASGALETSATDITATTDAGDIDIDNINSAATTASLEVTTGTGNILFSQSGDGSLVVTSASTADGSIGIDVDNASLTAQTVTAGGDDIDDNIELTTTIDGDVIVDNVTAVDNTITIISEGAITEVAEAEPGIDLTASTLSLTADTGISGQSAIETSATDITAATDAGDIDIDNINSAATTASLEVTTGAGNILFSQDGDGSLVITSASTADGSIGIDVDNASLTAQTVTAGGDDVDDNIELTTTTNGDVIVDDIRAIDNTITIISAGAITEVAEAEPGVDLTASTLSLTADTGISGQSALETSATDITATTDAGDIDIDNINSAATTASLEVTAGTGSILFSQDGDGSLVVTSASTADGSIGIDVDNASLTAQTVTAGGDDIDDNIELTTTASGDVTVDNVTAFDNKITIVSAGAISEVAETEPGIDLTASTLSLTADTGISGQSAIETSATDITAATDAGDIDIDNINSSATTASLEVTTETGSILFSQAGGGNLEVVSAGTANGNIDIDAADDVTLGSLIALGNQITISSDGAIRDAQDDAITDLTADTLHLTADKEIGFGLYGIETSATTIIAKTIDPAESMADIVIDNYNVNPTSLTASTVGTDSWILFDQTGGGQLTLTDVSTADGPIAVSAESGNISAASVNAGGNYAVVLTTTTSGNIVVDSVVSADNAIVINSAGSIEENPDDTVDLTAVELNLNAVNGIGTAGAIETSATLISADTINGDVDIDNVNSNPVTASSLTTGDGNILFSQSGGGDLEVTTASTTDGNIGVDVAGTDADLKVGNITAGGSGSVDLEAAEGQIAQDSGTIIANGGSLAMTQRDALDIKDFNFANQVNTNITLQSYDSSVTAVDLANGGKDENAADKWKSITATANDNIILQGKGDIKIGGDLTSVAGGVSVISDNGGIYDSGSYNYSMNTGTVLDNVNITGYSDGTAGVDLPAGSGKAAIILQSEKDLNLGPNCILNAGGSYDPTSDERQDVIFELDGEPIDIAVYLSSFNAASGTGSNVDVGSSRISINNSAGVGTLVIDAYDTVTFTDIFEDSLKLTGASDIKRLEATSRITSDLQTAINFGTLPHADDPASIADGEFVLSGGVYVLRGPETLLAKASILALTGPVPLVPPVPLEAEDRGEVEEENKDALMQWLVEELGEGNVQTYLARAYPPSLNTDLRPYKAAARLRNFATVIKDTEGSQIAALTQVVNEFIDAPEPPSEEQMALIVSALTDKADPGTRYALAAQWIDSLVEYVGVLNTEIGWTSEKSVAFVMNKYGSRLTEGGDIRAAMFVQMYMEESFGG